MDQQQWKLQPAALQSMPAQLWDLPMEQQRLHARAGSLPAMKPSCPTRAMCLETTQLQQVTSPNLRQGRRLQQRQP